MTSKEERNIKFSQQSENTSHDTPHKKVEGRIFNYSPQKHNFGKAYVRIIYEDGKVIEPLSKHYAELDRSSPIKSATIVSAEGKIIYTLPIKDNVLVYRIRNMARGLVPNSKISFQNPKRCFIIATKGKIVFVWDSEEIKELTEWEVHEPYTMPKLRDEESWF